MNSCKWCERQFEVGVDASFEHEGFTFHCETEDALCANCYKDYLIDMFERYCREMVAMKDGKIEVDWKKYQQRREEELTASNNRYNIFERFTAQILTMLGVFYQVLKMGGHSYFDIKMSGPFRLIPSVGGDHVYFAEERFAEGYGKTLLEGRVASWYIVSGITMRCC